MLGRKGDRIYFIVHPHPHHPDHIWPLFFFNLASAFTFKVCLYIVVLIDYLIWHRKVVILKLYIRILFYVDIWDSSWNNFTLNIIIQQSFASDPFHRGSTLMLLVGGGLVLNSNFDRLSDVASSIIIPCNYLPNTSQARVKIIWIFYPVQFK